MALNFSGCSDDYREFAVSGCGRNWICLSEDGKTKVMQVLGSGSGGLNELKDTMKANQDKVLFVVLRCNAVDEKSGLVSNREKYMFVTFIGASCPVLKKARTTVYKPEAEAFFGGQVQYNVDVDGGDLDLFSPLTLGKKMLAAGGAHKPIRYEFGPGQAIDVSAL
eukprot:717990_1